MKKVALSASMILMFILYAYHLRSSKVQGLKVDNLGLSGNSVPTLNTASPAASGQSATASLPPGVPSSARFKDGLYTGDVTDAFYGSVQVKAAVSDGKLVDVEFLQSPSDREESVVINSQAMPDLRFEAIQAQSAQVDTISGATQTSEAFRQSLQSALNHSRIN